jgi:hypothetical protein
MMNEQKEIELTEAQADKIEGSSFQLIQEVEGLSIPSNFKGFESVFAGMGIRGFACTGIKDDKYSKRLRPELQGMPVFSGLCGPMWNGYTEDGRPCIRYEDQKSNDRFSA